MKVKGMNVTVIYQAQAVKGRHSQLLPYYSQLTIRGLPRRHMK